MATHAHSRRSRSAAPATGTPPAPRTVLEALLPADGPVPLALVYETANLAGLEDQPLRLAIRRACAAGDVQQRGRGRGGSVELTAAGRARLARDRVGLTLALAQDAGQAPWDGRWHLIALTVPERDRTVRDALRRELLASGAAPVATSLYVSPHDLSDVLPEAARGATATAVATHLDVRGTTEPRALAEQLWPAAAVVAAYAAVTRALAEDDADGGAPVPVRQLRLADALDRAMRDDPLIPLELRAAPWAPSHARGAWAQRWQALRVLDGGTDLYRGWLD